MFEPERYISLTTFRRSGQPVSTPVWFVEDSGKLYVRTEVQAGKVKRLRNNPQVEVAPCTARGKPKGSAVKALCRILNPSEEPRPRSLISKKYGWQVRIVDWIVRLQRKRPVFLEINLNSA